MVRRIWIGLICIVLLGFVYLSVPSSAQGIATVPPTNTKRAPQTTDLPSDQTTDQATDQATDTPSGPTPTPIIIVVTSTPLPTKAAIPARLCEDCQRVRLRATPGSAGDVVEFLDPTTTLIVLARSDDSQWLQVSVNDPDNSTGPVTGWISVTFVRGQDGQPLDAGVIEALPVFGVSVQASPSPTSNVGIPPWMSGITSHSREIYLKGQQLGNHANVFSRVGDSMTFSPYFLTPFGQGKYDLGEYGSLSGVVSYYSQATARTGNSFVNQSLAAGGGWSAFTLLLPGFSEKQLCGDDSPLVCEYKQVKPAIALIMIGTNDSGSGSTGAFKTSLDQIIQTSIDMGVIPVLSTIPPKQLTADQSARVDAFNQVIHATAAQFDIPLWDYYSEMAKLPNKGMGSDGLHASIPPGGATGVFTTENLQYGYTLRNLMALQALDVLQRLVMN